MKEEIKDWEVFSKDLFRYDDENFDHERLKQFIKSLLQQQHQKDIEKIERMRDKPATDTFDGGYVKGKKVEIRFIDKDDILKIAEVTEGYIKEKYQEELQQQHQEDKEKIEVYENYLKRNGYGMQLHDIHKEIDVLNTLKDK